MLGTSTVIVKHSKSILSEATVLSFTSDEWKAFVAGVKAGEFDID